MDNYHGDQYVSHDAQYPIFDTYNTVINRPPMPDIKQNMNRRIYKPRNTSPIIKETFLSNLYNEHNHHTIVFIIIFCVIIFICCFYNSRISDLRAQIEQLKNQYNNSRSNIL